MVYINKINSSYLRKCGWKKICFETRRLKAVNKTLKKDIDREDYQSDLLNKTDRPGFRIHGWKNVPFERRRLRAVRATLKWEKLGEIKDWEDEPFEWLHKYMYAYIYLNILNVFMCIIFTIFGWPDIFQ